MGNLFRELIAYLTYDLKWEWLENAINKLCEVEMTLRWTADRKLLASTGKIPDGIYCYAEHTCPFWSFSRVARFFYGDQLSGYCYLMNEGDFNSDTMILWDQCKCCGINDEEDYDEEGVIECNLEL